MKMAPFFLSESVDVLVGKVDVFHSVMRYDYEIRNTDEKQEKTEEEAQETL